MEQSKGGNVTKLLQCWSAGDKRCPGAIDSAGIPGTAETRCGLPAARAVYDTLQPTALVHEAWIRLVDQGSGECQNRHHFFLP